MPTKKAAKKQAAKKQAPRKRAARKQAATTKPAGVDESAPGEALSGLAQAVTEAGKRIIGAAGAQSGANLDEVFELEDLDADEAELFADSPKHDLRLIAGGRVLLTISGKRYALFGPTMGGLGKIRADTVAIAESKSMDEIEEAFEQVWSTIFRVCKAKGGALPDRDEWPPFMELPEVLAGLAKHWRSNPLARGGNRPPARNG
ncbi:MAG: hypothetical protein AAFZ07_19545 [Actinomycetota bacterium]